jgi:hypothetical protein
VADHAVSSPTEMTAGDSTHHEPAQHGRPVSWVAVAVIVIGFTVGGIALPIGPTWWLFWVGVGIVVVGVIIATAGHVLDDWY